MIDLGTIARATGGRISGRDVLVRAPGHSARDASLSITVDPNAPDGFVVHSFAGDDPLATKDWVRERLGLPAATRRERRASRGNGQSRPAGRRPPVKLAAAPIPVMTPLEPGVRWGLQAVGELEPPPVAGEIPGRRHAYRRAGQIVRMKIKKTRGAPFIDFYLVRDIEARVTGWQAQKPEGYEPVPYVAALDPFDPELAADTVFWPEGEKDVDTLARLGLPAFTFGGAQDVPDGCAELLVGRDVVILADNDAAGRTCAEKKIEACATSAVRVRIVHFTDVPEKGDVSDWIEAGGTVEELWERIEAAETIEGASTEALLMGFAFDGDAAPEPPRFLVKNLLPAEGVAILGGQSGAGKTFTGIDLAVSLATGEPYFGRRVLERVGTLVLAAEGAGTMAGRIGAARLHRSDRNRLPIAWLGAVPNLADAKEVQALQPKIHAVNERMLEQFGVRLGLIVIDTLAAAFALADENDAAEAQQALRHMRMLGEAIGALVLPIHHYGKSEDTGLRGSSAYRGGADAVLSVLANRNHVTGEVAERSLNLAKNRHGEEGPIAGFELRFVELGIDDDGEPFGACVVEPTLDQPLPTTRQRPQKDPLPIVALKGAFAEVLQTHGRDVQVRGDGELVRAITVEELRPEFRRRYATGETDGDKAANTVRQALKRALAACPKHGFRTAAWAGEEWLWKA